METLFNGKEFTKMERARLGLVLVPMYGTAGPQEQLKNVAMMDL